MTNTIDLGKYKLTIVLRNPENGETAKQKYTFGVARDPQNYGNGCSMGMMHENGYSDYYDLRYDTDFHYTSQSAIMQYIANFAFRNWSGQNGSWEIIDLHIAIVNKA